MLKEDAASIVAEVEKLTPESMEPQAALTYRTCKV